jgi:hypothetical protein
MTYSARLSDAGTRALITLAVIGWLASIAAFSVILSSSQASARRAIEQRLVARTASGAEFASLYVKNIFVREHQQASILLGAHKTTPQAMERASSASGVSTAVLLNRGGRVLQVLPAKPALIGRDIAVKYAHLASAVAGRPAVSNVVPSAAQGLPVVGFAEPFQTRSGRRVFSGAYVVSDTPLGAYLSHLLVAKGTVYS